MAGKVRIKLGTDAGEIAVRNRVFGIAACSVRFVGKENPTVSQPDCVNVEATPALLHTIERIDQLTQGQRGGTTERLENELTLVFIGYSILDPRSFASD